MTRSGAHEELHILMNITDIEFDFALSLMQLSHEALNKLLDQDVLRAGGSMRWARIEKLRKSGVTETPARTPGLPKAGD